MKEINLRDYYPFYTSDVIVEVPDEVVTDSVYCPEIAGVSCRKNQE